MPYLGVVSVTVLLVSVLAGHARAAAASSSASPTAVVTWPNSSLPMPTQGVYVFGINSPVIQRSPTAMGPPDQTWNMTYSNISSSTFVPGMLGLGQASYVTTLSGASVTFQFVGTGISLLGSVGFFDTLNWVVDGVTLNQLGSTSPDQNVGYGWESEVAWARDLEWGLHTATLAANAIYEKLVLREIMIQTGIQGAVLTDGPTDTMRQIMPIVAGLNNAIKDLSLTGNWTSHDPKEGDTLSNKAFPQGYTVVTTNATNTTASIKYILPQRTAYVEVWGSTGWGFADYTVIITPPPPFNPPTGPYSANTAYYVPGYILSWAILDPSVDYILEYKAFGGVAEVWNVQYFYSNGVPKNENNVVGAIIGGSVSGLVVGIALSVLAATVLFRVYKKNQPSPPPVFEVDHGYSTRAQPFYLNPVSPRMEHDPLLSETQGYDDGLLGLNPATSASGHQPLSPASPGRTHPVEEGTSSGDASRTSSGRTTTPLYAMNDTSAPATFKTLPPSRAAAPPHRRGSAPPPLPLTVQERDSGAQVIHLIEYVPPAYDDNRRAARRSSASSLTSGRGDADDPPADDPVKPGGVRPLPLTPN